MSDHEKFPPTPPDCVNDFTPSFLPHSDEDDSDKGGDGMVSLFRISFVR